ncbi:MAG: hypothetical protein QOF57_1481 [Frankiaceae bacterium]|nr:hypothetical protein [Frankiaceae bacterium]MDQ1725978.1 hypothetical protein [Frankiaceae bacterium]
MPFVPRLVASDMDGTLLRGDLSISERTRVALAAVEGAGVPFVIVTGRPVRWLKAAADTLGHRGFAVGANGGFVYDLHTERVIDRFELEPQVAAWLVATIRRIVPGVSFAVERETDFGLEAGYRRHVMDDGAIIATAEELVTEPTIKLLARHDDWDTDDLMRAVVEAIGDAATVTHSMGGGLVEISAAGISKATSLARVCDSYGVAAADVVAFGDMPNDLPMLQWAGHGVAVANAHPDVLAAADEITFDNDTDGVAAVLERWFGGAPGS